MTDDCLGVSPEAHKEHHEVLQELLPELREFLEERRRSRERWEKFRQSSYGAIAVAIVGAVGSFLVWVGGLILQAIHKQ